MTDQDTTPKRAADGDDAAEDFREPTVAQRAITPASRGVRLIVPLAVAAVAVAGVTATALTVTNSSDGLEAQPAASSPTATRSTEVISRDEARPAITPASVTPTPAVTTPATRPTPTPAPTVKPTPAAKPTAKPTTATPAPATRTTPAPSRSSATPSYPMQLGTVVGNRYVTSGANLRTGPGTGYPVVKTVPQSTTLQATATVINGYRQVGYQGLAVWIKDTLTTTTKPSAPTTVSPGSTSGGMSNQACSSGSSVESGLVANAIKVHRAVCAQWPSITNYGGVRGTDDAHGSGRALDIMVSGSLGWEVAKWVRANASALGVTEVIYSQQIWTTQRASEGWRMMSDRGSATANHYDHVHVTVR